jgi:hypothetical protein
MSVSLAQFLVATAERETQLTFEPVEVVKFPLHIGKLL